MPAHRRRPHPRSDQGLADGCGCSHFAVPGQDAGSPSGITTRLAAMMTPAFTNTAAALAELPARGLVTTGPFLDPATIPEAPNVVVRGYVPHDAVLTDAAALVTHAGHGSIMSALRHGVPMVCLPAFMDQPDKAARVADLGAGLWVRGPRTLETIGAAIRAVLEDGRYRVAAQGLAGELAREDGAATVADQIESVFSRRSLNRSRTNLASSPSDR